MDERLKSRLAGLVIICMSVGGIAAVHWDGLIPRGIFPIGLAMFCPTMVSAGIGMIIEAPQLPVRELTRLGWVFLIIGIFAGLLHIVFFREVDILLSSWWGSAGWL